MIPTTPHVTLSAEQDKRETIQCIVYATVVVFGMLALLLHGMAFLSWTEEPNEEIYARKNMSRDVESLTQRVDHMEVYATEILKLNHHHYEYLNHTHVYSTGKPKGGD